MSSVKRAYVPLVPPILTTAQRDALTSIPSGALIDNSSTATLQRYDGTVWADVGSPGGWTRYTPAVTRTGNHTFTVAGDQTAIFKKSCRIRYDDSGTEYGVVGASSHSAGTTTVTLITTSDYAMAANPSTLDYSYAASPPGFPFSFAWAPTITGYSANPTSTVYRWSAIGNQITLFVREGAAGTSNATTHTYSLPFAAATITNMVWRDFSGGVMNNSANRMGGFQILSAGTTAGAGYLDSATDTPTTTFTASGSSCVSVGGITYEF